MFGPKITTVFASRWKALWWSAGVLMTAYCSVPSKDETDSAKVVLQKAAQKQSGGQHEGHYNPWAKSN